MKKSIRKTVLACAVLTAFVAGAGLATANPAATKKEKKPCVTCHITAKSKELNDVGKYYKEKKTLEGAPQKK
jgi:cytochrome c551/c552